MSADEKDEPLWVTALLTVSFVIVMLATIPATFWALGGFWVP